MLKGEEMRSTPGQNVSPSAQGLDVKKIFSRMVKIFDRFEKARLAASTSLLGLPSSPPR